MFANSRGERVSGGEKNYILKRKKCSQNFLIFMLLIIHYVEARKKIVIN